MFLFSFLVSLNVLANSKGGFIGGGGGTGINQNGQLYLLDLFQFDQLEDEEIENNRPQKLILTAHYDGPFQKIQIPYFNSKHTLESIRFVNVYPNIIEEKLNRDLLHSEVLKQAKAILGQYGLTLMLPLLGLGSLHWIFTDELPPLQTRFDLSNLLVGDDKLETIAYYFYEADKEKRSWQLLLSIPRWNRLNFSAQVGLVIHEALRHFQLGVVSQSRGLEFSEKILQKATALITSCEHTTYLEQYLLRYLSNYNGSFGGVDGLGQGYTYEEARKGCIRRNF